MITTLALIGACFLGMCFGWIASHKRMRQLEEANTMYLQMLIKSIGDQWKRSKVSFTTPEPQPPEPKQKPGDLGKAPPDIGPEPDNLPDWKSFFNNKSKH